MIKCALTGSSGVLGKKALSILPYKFVIFKGDIRNKKEVEKWIIKNDFDLLIHLAAMVPINKVNKNLKNAYEINVNGTKNIIEALIKKDKKPNWIFYASTSHTYKLRNNFIKISESEKPQPQNFYGKTKLIAENLLFNKLKNSNIKVCVGRIFSFTDKNQKTPFVIPSIIKKIKSSKKRLYLNNLNNYRDFISTKDIVMAIETLRKKQKAGIFNIGSGIKFSLKNIANLINKKYKKKIDFKDTSKSTYLISNNNKLKKLGWRPAEFNNKISYFY